MNHDDPLPPGQDSLDELIRGALSAGEVDDAASVARLEGVWRERSRLGGWRRDWKLIGAAACLLLAVGFALVQLGDSQLERVAEEEPQEEAIGSAPGGLEAPVHQNEAPPVEWPPEAGPSIEQLSAGPAKSPGRAPTDYERWMFAMHTRTNVAPAQLSLAEVVEAVVDRAARDPRADDPKLARADRLEVETLLLKELETAEGSRLRGVRRLLMTYGADRSVAPLVELSREPGFSRDALAAVQRIVGLAQWPDLVSETKDAGRREALVQHLLEVGSEPALIAFLRLVHNPILGDETLAAAGQLRELPVGALVALLDNEEPTIRLAASTALGALNRCEMTDALISRVEKRPSRSREAWYALLACRCDSATEFLSRAARSPRLLGQLNNARLQWSRGVR